MRCNIINNNDDKRTPLYIIIRNELKRRIVANEYMVGDKLSIRNIAEELKVSKMPVAEAFDLLQTEGLIESRPRSGTYVTSLMQNLASIKKSPLQEMIKSGKISEFEKHFTNNHNTSKPLQTANVDYFHNSYGTLNLLADALAKVQERFNNSSRTSSAIDSVSLKCAIITHVKRYGINADIDNIVIAHGIGETFHILSWALFNRSWTILHANSSFLNSADFLASSSVNVDQIKHDNEGIDIVELERKLKDNKNYILYLQMIHHNPTGITTSEARRDSILSLARIYNFPIIENDMYRDLKLTDDDILPLKADDNANQVIYIGSLFGTFSNVKTVWIVAPKFFTNAMTRVQQNYQLFGNSIPELVTEELIRSGRYYEFCEKLKPNIILLYNETCHYIDKYLGDIVTYKKDRVSFYIWLHFNNDVSLATLLEHKDAFKFSVGNVFDRIVKNTIKLNTLSVDPMKIESWIKNIATLVKNSYD